MTYFATLSKESVKGLGSAAYLVNVLPAAILIVSLFGLAASRLYPGSEPRVQDGKAVPPGLPSIVSTVTSLGLAGAALLVVVVLIAAILASPFQIAMVQVLEGRWTARYLALPEMLAVERHRRRRTIALWKRSNATYRFRRPRGATAGFEDVAAYARMRSRKQRRIRRASAVVESYPRSQAHILPTTLGNILRRAETTAGERYGLNTVRGYPRLYPHLSPRLDVQLGYQLNALDTSAALTLVLAVLTVASAPLAAREDSWRWLPAITAAGCVLAYRGAKRSAALYAELLCTAYDLHRFTMLEAMHRAIPDHPAQERDLNKELTNFLVDAGDPLVLPSLTHNYAHPAPPAGPAESGGSGPDRPTEPDPTA